jgi:lipopolysaccharide/colanic/teichoic acid biosynthesis glycosyltransferase
VAQEVLVTPPLTTADGAVAGASSQHPPVAVGRRTPAVPRRGYDVGKRVLDLVVTSVLLLLLAIPMLAIALAVRLDSPGPVFYRQSRLGCRRRRVDGDRSWETVEFRIWKFRTMIDGADESLHIEHVRAFIANLASTAPGARFKPSDDPRVTRVGRFLRRTSFDEFPQLLNVLAGEMSLIGPRPVPLYEAALYREEHLCRFGSKPGISGPWQIAGRCDVGFEEMMRMDRAYVQRRSLTYDLRLLLRTLPAIVSRRGAA